MNWLVYTAAILILPVVVLSVAGLIRLLARRSTRCPQCHLRQIREVGTEEQPGYGWLTKYRCQACGHESSTFVKG